uniref:FNIP repeat protein n=1 Tax=Pithovirus LCPAC001 TaxID=2506585 RepID=A0A481Z3L7_9VIRU|nr:MAG: FNIP repeat protein [Pithovirus LCPAC001]
MQGRLTYNQFQSKFKGLGLSIKQIGQAWSKYKINEIHNVDLTLINIRKLVSVIKEENPKSKTIIRRVSLVRKYKKIEPNIKNIITKKIDYLSQQPPEMVRLMLFNLPLDEIKKMCNINKFLRDKVCTDYFWGIYIKDFYSEYDDINNSKLPKRLRYYVRNIITTNPKVPSKYKNVTSMILVDFDQKIEKGVLPTSLTALEFGEGFDQKIEKGVLPISLTTLTFGINFNQKIEKDVLPSSLKTLKFGQFFNLKMEKDVLPALLTTLKFGRYFNQKIEKDVLPASLTTLKFGRHFNQKIEKSVLPTSLTTLTFKWHFNQKIKKGVLPKSLTTLEFEGHFNQKIEKGVLPTSLITLTFG